MSQVALNRILFLIVIFLSKKIGTVNEALAFLSEGEYEGGRGHGCNTCYYCAESHRKRSAQWGIPQLDVACCLEKRGGEGVCGVTQHQGAELAGGLGPPGAVLLLCVFAERLTVPSFVPAVC